MTKITKTKDGYVINDGGNVTPIAEIVDNGKTLKLPENSSNRKYFSIKRFEEQCQNGELELTYKETVTLGAKGTSRNTRNLEDYLDEADKALYLKLQAKAKKVREALKNDPVIKAHARLKKAQEEYKALLEAAKAKKGGKGE